MRAALPAVVLALVGCSSTPSDPDAGVPRDTPPRADTGPTQLVVGTDERPADLILPTAFDGTTPLPLLVLLHGYTASGELQDGYLGVSRTTRTRGVYLLRPDGTIDSDGNRFWNATDACCNFYGSTVDDVAYLTALLDETIETVPVDTTRIYFLGHSNGAFMSYRMACEISERIAAIAPLAGVDYLDPTACVPTTPVSVLHWHGTIDGTVPYDGVAGRQPGALASAERWAGYAGCEPGGATGTPIDVTMEAGDETVVTDWSGCDPGLGVTLWRMEGVDHIPAVQSDAISRVLDWLLEHHR